MVSRVRLLACFAVATLLGGCEPAPDRPAASERRAGAPRADSLSASGRGAGSGGEVEPDTVVVRGVRAATARLDPVDGSGVSGTVRLRQLDGGVRVRAEIDGLRRTRLHGFQILRAATCDEIDLAAHLGDDLGAPHGGPFRLPGDRHVGDLGNVRGGDGDGRYDRIDPVLRLNGLHSPVRRAVVVRAEPDDATQPDGGAGAVLACGVFQPGR